MARLFISLYLFITIALISLSAGLDRLFFSNTDTKASQVFVSVLEVAKRQGVDLSQLTKSLNLTFKKRLTKDIAWSQTDILKLKNHQALVLNDPQMGEQIYIALDENYILEISLPDSVSDSTQFFLYSFLFFLSLGGVIAIWIWPLWRDLSSLQKTVSYVLPDGSIAENTISKTSLIAPIAKSLNDMRSQIAHLMRNQRELSGAVAHEFRTPLARLKFALAMKQSMHDNQLEDMQKDVNELERLVQEMLDYARTDAQIPEMNLAEIPIKQLCIKLVEKLRENLLQDVEVNILGDDANVLADELFIERAIENLLLNAARYAKTQVILSIKSHTSQITICIEDDGIGIPDNMRNKIFEPFFRPDEGRGREQGGAGLGLAIVKRVIEWHKGKCMVEKSKLGGANFIIQLNNTLKKS